jgi:hypothetical protein
MAAPLRRLLLMLLKVQSADVHVFCSLTANRLESIIDYGILSAHLINPSDKRHSNGVPRRPSFMQLHRSEGLLSEFQPIIISIVESVSRVLPLDFENLARRKRGLNKSCCDRRSTHDK